MSEKPEMYDLYEIAKDFLAWGPMTSSDRDIFANRFAVAVARVEGKCIPPQIRELLLCLYETDEEIETWMESPNHLLGNEVPRELCRTEEGLVRCHVMLQALVDGAYL